VAQADTRAAKEVYIWILSTALMPMVQLIVYSLKCEQDCVFKHRIAFPQVRDQGPKQAMEREQRRSLGL